MNKLTEQEQELFNSLVGKTIKAIKYVDENEGIYYLTLDDGRVASFSSCGDDATYTSFNIKEASKVFTDGTPVEVYEQYME